MAGTRAEKPLVPTTIQVFADEWEEFKRLAGHRGASARIRELMHAEIVKAAVVDSFASSR